MPMLIVAPSRGKRAIELAFEKLEQREGDQDQLLVDFVDGGQKGETDNEEQPNGVNPVHGRSFAVEHF